MALMVASSMNTQCSEDMEGSEGWMSSESLGEPSDLQFEGDSLREGVLIICKEQVLAKFEATMRAIHDSHPFKPLLISFSKLFRSNINLSLQSYAEVADIHSTNITYKEFSKVISLERYVLSLGNAN